MDTGKSPVKTLIVNQVKAPVRSVFFQVFKGYVFVPIQKILQPAEGKAYRFSHQVVELASASGFPAKSYRIWFHRDKVVCAPVKQSHIWKDGQEHWRSYSVVQFAESFEKPGRLAVFSVRIPEELPRDWTHSLIPDTLRRSDPRSEQVTGAATDFLTLLDRSLRQIDAMAGTFRFVGDNGRLLQYVQHFRQSSSGDRVFNRLQSVEKQHDRSSIGSILSKLLHHDRLNTTVELHENRLTVGLGWQAGDDQALLHAAIEAVFGPHRTGPTPPP